MPKHAGFEIELGNHLIGSDAEIENPALDAARALVAAHHRLYGRQDGDTNGWTNEFDGNGFRMYLDHEHAEVCSPLVPSATLLTLALRDARSIVAACKREAEKQIGPIRVSFNCTNRQDVAWAFHGNFMVARHAFDAWREADWAPLKRQWVPFLVTSLPLVGTGKVGAENGAADCAFQFSQRVDFIDEEFGLSTTEHRNLINTRDEPLADPEQYARLHVIAWDTNLMEFANWLKFGISQALLGLWGDFSLASA